MIFKKKAIGENELEKVKTDVNLFLLGKVSNQSNFCLLAAYKFPNFAIFSKIPIKTVTFIFI